MNIEHLYVGTWLPRTQIHLSELFDFFEGRVPSGLDARTLEKHRHALAIEHLVYKKSRLFDRISFQSGTISVAIDEDGTIVLEKRTTDDLRSDVEKTEEFYIRILAPALKYVFSRGAPLPQTLAGLAEVYPKIFVGRNLKEADIVRTFSISGDKEYAKTSDNGLDVHFGQETEILNYRTREKSKEKIDYFIASMIFVQSYNDLLRRYLVAHRNVWEAIRELHNRSARYADFPKIQDRILAHKKTISFIQMRLAQMADILSSNAAIISDEDEQEFVRLGFGNFATLAASTEYLKNLWKMTEEHANETLKFFEIHVAENTQGELRLLQQFAVAGAVVGFFGMNIAFPWTTDWAESKDAALFIVLLVVLVLASMYFLLSVLMRSKKIPVSTQKEPDMF